MRFTRDLTIKYRNVDGVYYRGGDTDGICKLDDIDVINDLNKADMVCLVETHCSSNEIPMLSGFSPPISNVRPKTPGAPYNSGGILIYIKPEIRRGIKVMPETNSEFRWLKLERSFFKINHDIYVLVAYISNGSFAEKSEDIFELIENDIAKFSKNGCEFFVCGDFNARTNVDPDFCMFDENDNISDHVNLPFNMLSDVPLPRGNTDTHATDVRGKKLLNLCRSTGLRIVNGRAIGDTAGNLTCYSHSGKPSTIDYVLVSNDMIDNIDYFHVEDLDVHSIHCQLVTKLRLGHFKRDKAPSVSTSVNRLHKFHWKPVNKLIFQRSLASEHIQKQLQDFSKDLSTSCNNPNAKLTCNDAAVKIIDIITTAAKSANITKNVHLKSLPMPRRSSLNLNPGSTRNVHF